jgi:hypothetical protein
VTSFEHVIEKKTISPDEEAKHLKEELLKKDVINYFKYF